MEHSANILPLDAADLDPAPAAPAAGITRGVCRLLADQGYRTLLEFRLKSGRRADVIGLNGGGRFVIVEVKSSVADFRADRKWPDYRPFCDRLYFAVDGDFPVDLLPADCGVIVADAYQAAVLRRPPAAPMNGTRRKNQTLRFGLTAAHRLMHWGDPGI